jgi:hypothetical protein
MTEIYLVIHERQVMGTCATFGDAIECAFKLRFPQSDLTTLHRPDLEGTGLEGNKYDLMSRELSQLEDSFSHIHVRPLSSDPITSDGLALFPVSFDRSESPTAALQQAIYDVAEGAHVGSIRDGLAEELEGMLAITEHSPEEATRFLAQARIVGRFVGTSFKEELLGRDNQTSPAEMEYFLGNLTDNALNEFDAALSLKAPSNKGLKPRR